MWRLIFVLWVFSTISTPLFLFFFPLKTLIFLGSYYLLEHLVFKWITPSIKQEFCKFVNKSFERSFKVSGTLEKRQKKTIYINHGHGIFCISYNCGLIRHNGEYGTQNHITLVAKEMFWLPGLSFFLKLVNFDALTKDKLNYYMKKEYAIDLLPYGFLEAAIFEYGKDNFVLKPGIFAISYKNQYNIKSVYYPSEKYLFKVYTGFRKLRILLAKNNIPGILPYGKYGLLPLHKEIEIVEFPEIFESNKYPTPEELYKDYCASLKKKIPSCTLYENL